MSEEFDEKRREIQRKIKELAEKRKQEGYFIERCKEQKKEKKLIFQVVEQDEVQVKQEEDKNQTSILVKIPARKKSVPVLEEWPIKQQKKQIIAVPQQIQPPEKIRVEIEEESDEVAEMQIEQMLKQKKLDLEVEPENEEAMRELIVNTIRNKKPPKHRRRYEDPPTPFNELSEPYQIMKKFAEYYPRYKKRRQNFFDDGKVKIDLGVRYINELVVQCVENEIFPKSFIRCYKYQRIENEIQFINKFINNQLHSFNFENILFTSLDHRQLTEMLIFKHPEKYTLGERPYCVFKELSDFYQTIYKMNEEQYQQLVSLVRKKYNLYWWKEIQVNSNKIEEQVGDNFDTSTYFRPAKSPLFGAQLDNPENDFEQAKKRLYPDKEVKKRRSKSKKGKDKELSSQDNLNESDDEFKYEMKNKGKENSEEYYQSSKSRDKTPSNNEKSAFPNVFNSYFDSSLKRIFEDDGDEEKYGIKQFSEDSPESKPMISQGLRKPEIKKQQRTTKMQMNTVYKKEVESISNTESKNPKSSSGILESSLEISKMSSFGPSEISKIPSIASSDIKSFNEKKKKGNEKKSNSKSRRKR